MGLLAITGLIIAQFYVLGVITRKQEMTLETLLRQSGDMQKILAQRLHETQCQAGERQNGSGS
jgi:hypothetical protein